MSGEKGRDIYDLWYLVSMGTSISNKLIKEKSKYHHPENTSREEIISRVKKFTKKDFIEDLRPYVF